MTKRQAAKSPTTATTTTRAIAKHAPTPTPEQIEQVQQWIIDGARDYAVITSTIRLWPEWSSDPMPLISAAIQKITESAEFDANTVRGWCFEATKDVHRRMIESGDYAGALRAIRQLADMAEKQPPPDEPSDHDSPPVEATQ